MTIEVEYNITMPMTIEKLCICPVTLGDKKYVLFVAIDPDKNRQYEMVQTGSFDDKNYRIKLKPLSKWAKAKPILMEYCGYIPAAAFFLWMAIQ